MFDFAKQQIKINALIGCKCSYAWSEIHFIVSIQLSSQETVITPNVSSILSSVSSSYLEMNKPTDFLIDFWD